EELHTDVGGYDEALCAGKVGTLREARKRKGPGFDYSVEAPSGAEKSNLSGLKIETLPRIGEALIEAGFVKVRWHPDPNGQTILWAYLKFPGEEVSLSLMFGFKPEIAGHNFFSFDPSYERPLRGGTTDYQEFGELVVDIEEIPLEYPAGKLPRVVRPLAAQVEEGYRRYIEILSRFARVVHEELHTDVGAYDESLLRRLKEVREKGSTTTSWERI